jgi:hypothetical protein
VLANESLCKYLARSDTGEATEWINSSALRGKGTVRTVKCSGGAST